jgi:hypothetical protein
VRRNATSRPRAGIRRRARHRQRLELLELGLDLLEALAHPELDALSTEESGERFGQLEQLLAARLAVLGRGGRHGRDRGGARVHRPQAAVDLTAVRNR